jgi:hypothetical protein
MICQQAEKRGLFLFPGELNSISAEMVHAEMAYRWYPGWALQSRGCIDPVAGLSRPIRRQKLTGKKN